MPYGSAEAVTPRAISTPAGTNATGLSTSRARAPARNPAAESTPPSSSDVRVLIPRVISLPSRTAPAIEVTVIGSCHRATSAGARPSTYCQRFVNCRKDAATPKLNTNPAHSAARNDGRRNNDTGKNG